MSHKTKLGIMQPYFLPYLGYFALIKYTNEWVVFDTAQFIRHGWIERNRILKPDQGWQYIKVPLAKHIRETPINCIRIRTDEPWRELILAQVEHYKKIAPHYGTVSGFLREALSFETESISELNLHLLDRVCAFLGVPFNRSIFSKSGLKLPAVAAPDDWALYISLALGAQEYVNLPGGKTFFDRTKYQHNNLGLTFLSVNLNPYSQGRINFEPGLSMLDVMMFNARSEILQMLNDYTIS